MTQHFSLFCSPTVSLVPGLPNKPESSEWVEGLTQQHTPPLGGAGSSSGFEFMAYSPPDPSESKRAPGRPKTPSQPQVLQIHHLLSLKSLKNVVDVLQQAEMQHQEDAHRAATELGAKETPEVMDNAPLEITLSAAGELGAREKTPQLTQPKIRKRKKPTKGDNPTSDHEASDIEHLKQKKSKRNAANPGRGGKGGTKGHGRGTKHGGKVAGDPKKMKRKTIEISSEEEDIKDKEVQCTLIVAIEDDADIKQALFPPPGQGTLKTNGKPKTDSYLALAHAVFDDHPFYGPMLAGATTAAAKSGWVNKIKNKIDKLRKKTNEHTADMGETGAGLEREEDINMDLNNAFTTKWAKIKATDPWYWRMRELISQRPNSVLVGIGSNDAPINYGVLGQKSESVEPSSTMDDEDEKPVEETSVVASGHDADKGDQGESSGSDELEEEENAEIVVDRWGRNSESDEDYEESKPAAVEKKKQEKKPDAGKKKVLLMKASKLSAAAVKGGALTSKKTQSAAQSLAMLGIKEEETLTIGLKLKADKIAMESKRIKADREKEKWKAEKWRMKMELHMKKMELKLKQAWNGNHVDWNTGPGPSYHSQAGSYGLGPSYSQAGDSYNHHASSSLAPSTPGPSHYTSAAGGSGNYGGVSTDFGDMATSLLDGLSNGYHWTLDVVSYDIWFQVINGQTLPVSQLWLIHSAEPCHERGVSLAALDVSSHGASELWIDEHDK
ncbi:hypothetical protein C8J56DRAFT_1164966 [Mycena floridula]|nr:hypothetical protein C8J56DRAFT_1164966 [Mycena floridula]